MFGTLKVPKGERSPRPPPSLRRLSCPGVAWQLAQPPMLNMASPLDRTALLDDIEVLSVGERCPDAEGGNGSGETKH